MSAVVESIGLGTTAFINDGASAAYVGIFNLISITPPAAKLKMVESKRLDLPNDTVRQVPTLFDGGELSIKQQFSNAGFARIETLRTGKTLSNVKFVVPDDSTGTTFIAPGYFTQNKPDTIEPDKITEFDSMFTVSDLATA